EIFDALALGGNGLDDRRVPHIGAVGKGEQGLQLLLRPKHPFAVGLVYHENVADLHYSGLYCLNVVAHTGHQYDDGHVRGFYDLDLVLADADRLDDHLVKAGRVEDRHGIDGCTREPPKIAACRHRADKNVLVEAERGHSDAVAENSSAG